MCWSRALAPAARSPVFAYLEAQESQAASLGGRRAGGQPGHHAEAGGSGTDPGRHKIRELARVHPDVLDLSLIDRVENGDRR